MSNTRNLWRQLATLFALLAILSALILFASSYVGLGPNLGLRFGYYGRFNRVLAQIEGSSHVQLVKTTLHHDLELEDFYITVRTQDERVIRLRFEGASTRPFNELVQELKRVGI